MHFKQMVCAGISPKEAARRIQGGWSSNPKWIWVQHAVSHPSGAVAAAFADVFPESALHIATSCLGVMSNDGAEIGPGGAIGALGLWDDSGDYGSAAADFGDDPAAAACRALACALAAAGRPREAPELIWLSATPGHEEAVIAALIGLVGPETLIYGGTAADNNLSGQWRVSDGSTHSGAGLVVSVLFPGVAVGHAFQSGYAPLGPSGTVTSARGRLLETIDDRPAREVYDRWTGGKVVVGPADQAVPVLAQATWWPLGRTAGGVNGVPFHLLFHPAEAGADGSLSLFADVAEGEELHLMGGTPESLTMRAARTVALAMDAEGLSPADVAGALVIFCGGSMLAMQSSMDAVAEGIDATLCGAPFLGAFTFGEQGWSLTGGNKHANLMISAIVLGKE